MHPADLAIPAALPHDDIEDPEAGGRLLHCFGHSRQILLEDQAAVRFGVAHHLLRC